MHATRTIRSTALALLLLASAAAAQTPAPRPPAVRVAEEGRLQSVVLVDGSTLHGRIIDAGDPVRFVLISGDTLQLRPDRIAAVEDAGGRVVDGRLWPADPNETRLFFGPTARSLPAGGGYVGVYELFFPFVAVGVTSRVTLAGGTPLFLGEGGPGLFWLAPKVQVVETQRIDAAVGTLSFFADEGSAGVAYAVATLGRTTDESVTLGLGYGYADDELADRPVVMLGGEARVSPRVKLVSENYLFAGEGALVSVGPRFFGERLTADLGLVAPLFGGGGLFVFPLVNFVWNW